MSSASDDMMLKKKKKNAVDPLTAYVPAWASRTIIFSVILSTFGTAYLSSQLGAKFIVLSAIPFFLLMILTEYLVIRASAYPTTGASYSLVDTYASLSAGLSQLIVVGTLQLEGGPFRAVHEWFAARDFPLQFAEHSIVGYVLFLFVYDFLYYWLHRCGHTISVLWAGHSVHHSGERYNLSTALRQSWWQAISGIVFYLPAAPFFPVAMLTVHRQWNAFFQFWVHTCVVRRVAGLDGLGSLGLRGPWLIATPSFHRIHHDRRYHKNFAGIFVVWDRLFGTYLDEAQAFEQGCGDPSSPEEFEVFGTMQEIESWAEPAIQYAAWGEAIRKAIRTPLHWYRGPGWHTALAKRNFGRPESSSRAFAVLRLYSDAPTLTRWLCGLQFFLVLIPQLVAMRVTPGLPFAHRAMCGALGLSAFVVHGLVFDGHRWAYALEVARLAAVGTWAYVAMLDDAFPYGHVPAVRVVLGMTFFMNAVQMWFFLWQLARWKNR